MNRQAPASRRSTHYPWLLVSGLMFLAVLGHFNRVSISVAGSDRFIRDGILTERQMGEIYSAFLWVYTLCMLPAGWIIDRFGPVRALAGMALGMGACVIATGLAGTAAVGTLSFAANLLFIRGLAGAFSAPLHPAAARGVSLWVSPQAQMRANGLITAGALLGVAASYPLFGWLMERLDWQAAFVVSGAVMIVAALAWWRVAGELVMASPRTMSNSTQLRQLIELCQYRGLILISLSYAAVGYFQYLFMYWIHHYLTTSLGRSDVESRNSTAVIMLAMAAGMSFGGWFAEWLCRHLGKRWGRRALVLGGMLLSSLLALAGLRATNATHAVTGFALAFAALGMCEGVFWTSVTDMGGAHGGTAAAMMNTGGNAGGALAPWLTALLKDRFGWPVAIGVACAVSCLGGLVWLALEPDQKFDGPDETAK
jgi:MFS family permease